MAKAKNIATGTFVGSGNRIQSISGIGFKPDHIAICLTTYNSDHSFVICVYDTRLMKKNGASVQTSDATLTFNDDGVVVTAPESVNGLNPVFIGTYAYVAWQD